MICKKLSFSLNLFLLCLMCAGILPAQQKQTYTFSDFNKWKLPYTGVEKIEYKGKNALQLNKGSGERIAFLKDVNFENGIIELDIAAIPFYTGLVFRVRSEYIYEGIYFRPQNSRHENPVTRGHAV